MEAASGPDPLLLEVSQTWSQIIAATPLATREAVQRCVDAHAERVASAFYDQLLAHETASRFLSNEVVSERLHAEMRRWLCALFRVGPFESFDAHIAHQIAVGSVHARIKLPVELMSIGSYVLGRELTQSMADACLDAAEARAATHYIMALLSLATGLILSAFVRETQKGARNDEAYRLVAFRHDALLERERQRAALSEWAQRTLMSISLASRRGAIVPIRQSAFAQWFSHKGLVLFEGVDDAQTVLDAMVHIDTAILPRLASAPAEEGSLVALTEELDSKIEYIRYVVNDLFNRISNADMGRDSVTRLLNRRYLNAILSREIETHQASGQVFAVILVRIASPAPGGLGMDSEDRRNAVLQKAGLVLTDFAGAGDHVFRYTENDFLLVEVETHPDRNLERLELLRQKLEAVAQAGLSSGAAPAIRIATATFDGHPDYQRLLRRVEFAISSSGSRDGVVVA